ncbi:hypothetical protein [Arthrobacter agilis]|uniref:hypothetical protein n=1 Tax=Arthrobacter agilis TaxID=37921 RepID=UPI002787C637|nr:hypothetical protein [Arthrobacter agilis]MDQ0736296.1 hypothetical protein [Arthrobacter agilis]
MTDWDRITAAVGVSQGGDKDRGRELLMECWDATEPADHAHRCVLAHYLADTETEIGKEVAWDEKALEEHAFLAEDDLAALGIPSARSLRPSLHLNLADGYHRQDRTDLAQAHLERGQAATEALQDDGYGKMIRSGLDNLAQRMTTPR